LLVVEVDFAPDDAAAFDSPATAAGADDAGVDGVGVGVDGGAGVLEGDAGALDARAGALDEGALGEGPGTFDGAAPAFGALGMGALGACDALGRL
jgi:hypothetical protein